MSDYLQEFLRASRGRRGIYSVCSAHPWVIEAAMRQALPWEDWFTDAAHLRQAFEEAELASVELHYASYTTRMSIADFLEMRETALQARFIRDTLPAPRWQEFKQTLSVEFYKRFKDPIEHTRDVHIAIGTA